MDRDDLFHYTCHIHHHRRRQHTACTQFSYPRHYHDFGFTFSKCSSDLLMECASAVHVGDMPRAHHCMWMLNEMASPYGDTDQKLAFYFLQALFSRITLSGNSCRKTLQLASDKGMSFDVVRRTALQFQEVSPWSTFGHVASNAAILECLGGEQRMHIIDVSNTFCTQWPTFLEALASLSSGETPHLRLTTVVVASVAPSPAVEKVMREISWRIEKFARLMRVPFKFQCVHHGGDLSSFDFDAIGSIDHSTEAVAINCVNSMHGVPTSTLRDSVLAKFRRVHPRVITLVEEEADIYCEDGGEVQFLKSIEASLSFFTTYLDCLEKSFSKTSKERLVLEKSAGRAIMDLVACSPEESGERRETGWQWSNRMRTAGFEPFGLSSDGTDDVKALVRRYREGWSIVNSSDVDVDEPSTAGICLAWKEQAVVWACAWKPTEQ